MNDDMHNNEELDELIKNVVEKPKRSEPRIDVKDIVMRRIAEEPQQAHEQDFGIWGMVCGIVVLIALAVVVDVMFLSDLSSTWEMTFTTGVEQNYSVSYIDVLVVAAILPVMWYLLLEPKRQGEEA